MCLGKGGRNPHSNVSVRSSTSCVQPAEVLSDGEQMTAELRDIVCQFMQKVSVKMCQRRNLHTPRSICHPSPNQVEEFKQSVSHLSVSTTEQQDVSFLNPICSSEGSAVSFFNGDKCTMCPLADAEERFGGSGSARETIHQQEGRAQSIGDAELHGCVQEHWHL